MADVFSSSEVVELGIEIEKNGRDFYNALAAQAKNLVVIEAFKFLAREEEKHIHIFSGILEKIKGTEPQIYADEYIAYINALAGEYVFTQKGKGKVLAKGITDSAEVIEVGIDFEKDSIVFYEGLKQIVPQSDASIIGALIKEEKKHLLKLLQLKKQGFENRKWSNRPPSASPIGGQ